MNYCRSFFVIITCFLVANCSDDSDKKKHNQRYIIYSPNAEPLSGGILGYQDCEKVLIPWFARVDTNHDGFIDKVEFNQDAKTQFGRMDIDNNLYLVSEELDRYRAPFRPQDTQSDSAEPVIKKHLGHHKDLEKDAASRKSPDAEHLLDPVMSADTNLDFKVTLDEFLAQSGRNFDTLDADHDNKLNNQEILAICKKK